MPVLTNSKRLLSGKVTTTNPVERIATMDGVKC